MLQEDALLAILLFEMQLRDTAKQAAASSASALSDNNNVSAVDDFSAANFALHQAAVRLPLAELDHIMEDDVDDREDEEEEEDGTEQKKKKKKGEQDKSGRSVTMTAGSSGERLQQPPPKLNLSALLHVSVNICPVIANYPIQLRALQARQPPLRFHLYNWQWKKAAHWLTDWLTDPGSERVSLFWVWSVFAFLFLLRHYFSYQNELCLSLSFFLS